MKRVLERAATEFRRWNDFGQGMHWMGILLGGALVFAWLWHVSCYTGEIGLSCLGRPLASPFLVAYVVVGAGGMLGTLVFTEMNIRALRSMKVRMQVTVPRLRAVYTGALERVLFTTASIVLLHPGSGSGLPLALAAITIAYVGLKGFAREERAEGQFSVSMHTLWGTGVSIGFAVFGGWLFWQVRQGGVG